MSYRQHVVLPLRDTHCWLSSLLRYALHYIAAGRITWLNLLLLADLDQIWESLIRLLFPCRSSCFGRTDMRTLVYHGISVAEYLLGWCIHPILNCWVITYIIVDMIVRFIRVLRALARSGCDLCNLGISSLKGLKDTLLRGEYCLLSLISVYQTLIEPYREWIHLLVKDSWKWLALLGTYAWSQHLRLYFVVCLYLSYFLGCCSSLWAIVLHKLDVDVWIVKGQCYSISLDGLTFLGN